MRTASGLDSVELVTRLLRRAPLDDPVAGLWEAADLQWWWRSERSSDAIDQSFWVDEAGEPVAAVIFTDWGRMWACDLIVVPSMANELVPTMWAHALGRSRDLSIGDVEIAVRDDDLRLISLVTDSGFPATGARGAANWMDVADRSAVTQTPHGYRLCDRTESGDRPHHFVPRAGSSVVQRLAQTSLYRQDLDVFVEASDGVVASYGLFWFDPITKVGFVEPMRTESAHRGRGLATHVLLNELERLAALGGTRVKVNHEIGNKHAESLYRGAGSTTESTSTLYARAQV